jgi:hypothetical protein
MTTMPQPPPPQVDTAQRILLVSVRQALLIIVAAIETYLGLERSRVPRHVERNGH